MNFNEMLQVIDNLKKQQQPGESPIDVVKRVLGGQLNDQQKADLDRLQTPVVDAPKAEKYRFKSFDEMNPIMQMKHGVNWKMLLNPNGSLDHVFGLTPESEVSQREMRRVYLASDNAVGSILHGDKAVNFIREMIQPV